MQGSNGEGEGGKLRVVRILTRFNVGGPARQALALQKEMAELGAETVLVGGVVQDGEADLAEVMGCSEVARIPEMGRRPSPSDDLTATRKLFELIRRVRPHVVHTHMAKAGAIGRVAAACAGAPARVHTFHGHTLHGYFGRISTAGVVVTERVLARLSTALIAVSHRVRSDLLARGVGRPERFHVIGAGLDLTPYERVSATTSSLRDQLGIGAQDQVIGFAGRLVPVKGIDVFLKALETLLVERPNVHVVVAGDGPEVELVTAAQSAPFGSRLHRVGWVADVADLYSALDVVALSSHNEGTPLALIEAGAAGLPVVATAVGGVPEVVEHGRTGFLVPPASPHELAAALRLVLEDRSLARRLGSAGKEMAGRFSAAQTARSLLGLYRQLLSSHPQPRESEAG